MSTRGLVRVGGRAKGGCPRSRAGSTRNPDVDPQSLLDERIADHFHDQCGVFGAHGHPEAANITYLGLYALQHRGQESAGIVSSDGRQHRVHRAMGLVADIFSESRGTIVQLGPKGYQG